jgi:hypothetical protein
MTIWYPVIILEFTDRKFRKDSFLQRAINLVEGIKGTDFGDGVGSKQDPHTRYELPRDTRRHPDRRGRVQLRKVLCVSPNA